MFLKEYLDLKASETPEECAARRAKLPIDKPIKRETKQERNKRIYEENINRPLPKTVTIEYEGNTYNVKFRNKWSKLSQEQVQKAALDSIQALSINKKTTEAENSVGIIHRKHNKSEMVSLEYNGYTYRVKFKKKWKKLSQKQLEAAILGSCGAKRNKRRKKSNRTRLNKSNKNRRTEYEKYIRSEVWRKFSKMIRDKRGNKCEKCDIQACETEEGFLHVHHLHYDNFQHEKEEDVQVLCTPCHEEAHGRSFDVYGKQAKQ